MTNVLPASNLNMLYSSCLLLLRWSIFYFDPAVVYKYDHSFLVFSQYNHLHYLYLKMRTTFTLLITLTILLVLGTEARVTFDGQKRGGILGDGILGDGGLLGGDGLGDILDN